MQHSVVTLDEELEKMRKLPTKSTLIKYYRPLSHFPALLNNTVLLFPLRFLGKLVLLFEGFQPREECSPHHLPVQFHAGERLERVDEYIGRRCVPQAPWRANQVNPKILHGAAITAIDVIAAAEFGESLDFVGADGRQSLRSAFLSHPKENS